MAKIRTAESETLVMLVDWRRGAQSSRWFSLLNYHRAAAYVPLMGAALASLVQRLMKEYEFHPDQVEIVGFSLGGQIGGYFTKFLMKDGIKISRFVGEQLDSI